MHRLGTKQRIEVLQFSTKYHGIPIINMANGMIYI